MSDSVAKPVDATFDQFGLAAEILKAIAEQGYTTPTPIQAKAIPVVLSGRDVMGAAQTGTGKTASFSLPIIQRLLPQANTSASPARPPVRALILTPTRELADQVAANVHAYAKHTPLRSAVVFGGVDMNPQMAELRRGVEILIATPGRLLDHVQQKTANLGQVQILVLDEADRMLDMGFLPDLQRILNLLPKERQTLLFSATFSPEIKKLASTYLRNPQTIEVARSNAAASTVTQIVYDVAEGDKQAAVVKLIRDRSLKQVIVFCNSKIGASRLARQIERDGIIAAAIHGDRSQSERMQALDAFKRFSADRCTAMAASIAFYSAFSLAPTLVMVIAVAGWFFGADAARGEVFSHVHELIGNEAAAGVQTIVENAHRSGSRGGTAALISFAMLALGASATFASLNTALSVIWPATGARASSVLGLVRIRLISFGLVLGVAFLLIVSLVLDTAITFIGRWLWGASPYVVIGNLLQFSIGIAVLAFAFGTLMKFLPDARVSNRDAMTGGIVSAVLFSAGKKLFALYLAHAGTASAFGAAGSFAVLLMWLYFSAAVLLRGAEFAAARGASRDEARRAARAPNRTRYRFPDS